MNPLNAHTAIILLAAGGSARLGSPKQLLTFNGKNLLRHAVDVAVVTGCSPVVVVLGSDSDLLRKELEDKSVVMVENTNWKEGMASSIRCGLEWIQQSFQQAERVLILVCDQPFITAALLWQLLEKGEETGMPVIASRYEGVIGTPAVFHKNFFPALMELQGDKGAGKLIAANPKLVATVSFPRGITDIDTAEEYERLKKP